jgi:siroheme synthase
VTDRRYASAFTVVTAHRLDTDQVRTWAEIAGSGTLVVLMGLRSLPELTSELVKGGLDPQTSAVVVASATRENQRIVRGRVSTIARRARELEPPATVLIGSVVDLGLELSKARTPLESLVAA